MTSISHVIKESMIITLIATGLSVNYMSAPYMSNVTFASHINHKRIIIRKHIRPKRQINNKHELYLDHHTTGTLRLSKPLRVQSALDGDQRIITIPKGQVLHYKKQTPNVIVWNKRYPNNSYHQYDAYGRAVQQQISKDAKSYSKNKNTGMPNVYKHNIKERNKNKYNKQNRHIKSKLPKTSDDSFSPEIIFANILSLIIGGFLLINKGIKYIKHSN